MLPRLNPNQYKIKSEITIMGYKSRKPIIWLNDHSVAEDLTCSFCCDLSNHFSSYIFHAFPNRIKSFTKTLKLTETFSTQSHPSQKSIRWWNKIQSTRDTTSWNSGLSGVFLSAGCCICTASFPSSMTSLQRAKTQKEKKPQTNKNPDQTPNLKE